MKNTLFFPGLGETPKTYKKYTDTYDIAKIDWNTGETTPYEGYKNIVSFSLGCVFSLDAGANESVNKLILCSPTPFESLGDVKAKEIYFVIGETEDFSINIFKPLLKDPRVKMLLVPNGEHRYDDEYHKIVSEIITKK